MVGGESACTNFLISVREQILRTLEMSARIPVVRCLRGGEPVHGLVAMMLCVGQIWVTTPHRRVLSNRDSSSKNSDAQQSNPNDVTSIHA
jgi:hypothetical protein